MTSRRLRLVVAAEESAGIQLLRALMKTEHEIVAVVSREASGKGSASVHDLAGTLDLPRIPARRMDEDGFAGEIRLLEPDLLLNVHSLHILPEEVLEAPRLGAYNLHPGPLPEMAGLNVPSWAVFEGRDRHGVTVHRMEVGIDTGAIAYEEHFDVRPDETGLSLMLRCVRTGLPLVLRVVDDAAAERPIPASEQDLGRRRYYGREVPNGGWIDWTWPATRISAFVRACDYGPFPSPWGRPRTAVKGTTLEVTSVEADEDVEPSEPGVVIGVEPGAAVVASGRGVVRVKRVWKEGVATEPEQALCAGVRLQQTPAEGT